MKIGGLQKVSLIDYPEKICAIVFLQGCNFRCPYCHNPELVDPARFGPCLDEDELFAFLEKRKGKLDAVSITGGEPTIQRDLPQFIGRIRAMGFLVKLDTNGSCPEVLEKLLNGGLVDYVAMDIKGPLKKYDKIAGVRIPGDKIERSIDLIRKADVRYEFRTTVVKPLLQKSDFPAIGKMIGKANLYVLQRFVPSKALDEAYLKKTPFSDAEFQAIQSELQGDVSNVVIR